MKSIIEIEIMLESEINNHLDKLKNHLNLDYFNELFGDTSFILAGLLEKLIKAKNCCWNEKWIDDSLLKKIKLDNKKISIWGIMIWGKVDTNEQWTDPFYFETFLSDFKQYFFLFGDLNQTEIIYDNFNKNRDVWDKCYYSDDNWHPSERNWKYKITSS